MTAKKSTTTGSGLAVLIDTACKSGWIQFDMYQFLGPVKEFRNFIHPAREVVS